MDQGVGWQPQAKVPSVFLEVVKQSFMYKAAIGKQRDHHIRWDDGAHLIEHQLVGFKTDLGAPMTQGSPSQRDGAPTIDQGGTDEHKRREGRRMKSRHTGDSQKASP